MQLEDILDKLQAPFLPEEHKERKIPGGGRWLFVPWQTIRERLNKVAGVHWEVRYDQPVVVADYLSVKCRLIICGVVREGIGNDKAFPELNESGKAKTFGAPIENATADAFKNAAEQFGIAAYLDDQKKTIALLNRQGDGRAFKYAKENEWIEAGAMGRPKAMPPKNSAVEEVKPQLSAQPQTGMTLVPTKLSDREKVYGQIANEMQRIGWSAEDGKKYLTKKYKKQSRLQLTDVEVMEFLHYLLKAPVSLKV